MDTDKIFDYEEAFERAGKDNDFLLELINVFENTSRNQIQRIRELIAKGELFEAYREAHSMKGAALNLGAKKVGNLAKEFEIKLKNGEANVDLLTLQEYLDEFIITAKEVILSKSR